MYFRTFVDAVRLSRLSRRRGSEDLEGLSRAAQRASGASPPLKKRPIVRPFPAAAPRHWVTRDRGCLDAQNSDCPSRCVCTSDGGLSCSALCLRLRRGCRTVIRRDVKRPHHPVRSPISRRSAAPLAPPWDPQTRQHSGSAPRRRNDQRPFRRGDRSVSLQSEVTSLQRCGVKIPRLRRDCPAECVWSPRSWANPLPSATS